METSRRRPRSPALGRLYTQLLPDYSQKPPAVRALSCCPVPSSCIWLLSQTHPHRTTTFCHHHTTAMEKLCSPPQLCGLHNSPEEGHQRGTHPSKAKSVSPFLLGSGNGYQLCAPPAPKNCPKLEARLLAMAKCATTMQEAFTRAYSLLPRDFDAVKSYLRQVWDLKWFPTSGRSSQSLKTKKRLSANGSV